MAHFGKCQMFAEQPSKTCEHKERARNLIDMKKPFFLSNKKIDFSESNHLSYKLQILNSQSNLKIVFEKRLWRQNRKKIGISRDPGIEIYVIIYPEI